MRKYLSLAIIVAFCAVNIVLVSQFALAAPDSFKIKSTKGGAQVFFTGKGDKKEKMKQSLNDLKKSQKLPSKYKKYVEIELYEIGRGAEKANRHYGWKTKPDRYVIDQVLGKGTGKKLENLKPKKLEKETAKLVKKADYKEKAKKLLKNPPSSGSKHKSLYQKKYESVKGSSISAYLRSSGQWVSGWTFRFSGTHHVAWWGLNPYYADTVKMTEIWYADGFRVSFQGPFGSDSGWTRAKITNTINSTSNLDSRWHLRHYYGTINLNGVTSGRGEQVSGQFCWGGNCYTVRASDYEILPAN